MLDWLSGMRLRVVIVVDSGVLICIIVVRITLRIVKIEQIVNVMFLCGVLAVTFLDLTINFFFSVSIVTHHFLFFLHRVPALMEIGPALLTLKGMSLGSERPLMNSFQLLSCGLRGLWGRSRSCSCRFSLSMLLLGLLALSCLPVRMEVKIGGGLCVPSLVLSLLNGKLCRAVLEWL